MSSEALLGLDFGGTKIALALAELTGETIAVTTVPTNAADGAEQALERGITAARDLLRHRQKEAAAVGIATMGLTRDDRVDLAPNVPGWNLLALPDRFRAAFAPAPVAIDNDVRAAARAELTWGELSGVQTGIYLNLGSGLAATLVIGGEIVVGAHDAAGEVGYWLRSRADRPGSAPLEEYAGGAGIRRRARAELGVDAGLGELMASPDRALQLFVTDLFDEIAVQVTNLVTALDPERLVIGGGFVRDPDRLLAVVQSRVAAHVPFPPEVRLARFGGDAALAGAIALAMRVAGD